MNESNLITAGEFCRDEVTKEGETVGAIQITKTAQ